MILPMIRTATVRRTGYVKVPFEVLITLEKLSKDMNTEAIGAGFYHSDGWNKDFPKLQILTVEDLLNGKQVQLPPSLHTFKQAEKLTSSDAAQHSLGFE
jgi:site-specific DNA-methyltransferase (adenine-specific)